MVDMGLPDSIKKLENALLFDPFITDINNLPNFFKREQGLELFKVSLIIKKEIFLYASIYHFLIEVAS